MLDPSILIKKKKKKTLFGVDEKLEAIKKAIDDGMSKASSCRTFGVKRSTLIDSLNR